MHSFKLFGLLFLLISPAMAEPTDPCELSVRVESERQHRAAGALNSTQVSQQFYAVLDSLTAKVNCTVWPIALPAGRAMRMLEDGQLDIMVGMSQTPQRLETSYFIGPHHTERVVVVASKSIADSVTNLQQLLEVNGAISVAEGAYYGPQWQQMLQKNPQIQQRLFATSGNQQKLAMLVSGRVIASLEDEAVVDELLKQHDFGKHFHKLFVIHENPVYFAFSHKAVDNALHMQLQQQWRLMLASGEVARIQQQLPLTLP